LLIGGGPKLRLVSPLSDVVIGSCTWAATNFGLMPTNVWTELEPPERIEEREIFLADGPSDIRGRNVTGRADRGERGRETIRPFES
jgi:hypothetical protein